MKKKLFTLAVLAMIMVSCAQDNLEIEAEGSRTITVSATMPETDNDAQTRVSLTPDAETGAYGIILKWETDDKLMLCFEKDGTYYRNEAPIVASSISSDGKSAEFTITIPDEIPADATFNLYGVYQKTDENTNNGGFFRDGTKTYELENYENQGVTLDKIGSSQSGIARPMLYFSQANIENSLEPSIAPMNLTHSGWMMALHFKNSSGAEINLPTNIKLDNPQGTQWVWNDYDTKPVHFDFATQTFAYNFPTHHEIGRSFSFLITDYNWLPLYGQKLADGESIVFYRWLASLSEVPELIGETFIANVSRITPTKIAAKTVTNGKIYHVYSEWDGTNYKFVSAY